MFRQKLNHQHCDLVAEKRVRAALWPQPDGHWQNIARARGTQALMQTVKFQNRDRRMILRAAQHSATAHGVRANQGSFFSGKVFNPMLQSRRGSAMSKSE